MAISGKNVLVLRLIRGRNERRAKVWCSNETALLLNGDMDLNECHVSMSKVY
jgi:hypothetical protein